MTLIADINKSENSRVDLNPQEFDILVNQKGLDLCHEVSGHCSCREKTTGAPVPNCPNCFGIGHFFFDPVDVRGIITDLSMNPKFMQWGLQYQGICNLTMEYTNRMGYMDRITLLSGDEVRSEVIYPKMRGGELGALMTYESINDSNDPIIAYLYKGQSTAHIALVHGTDFTVSGRKIVLDSSFHSEITADNEYVQLSIRYRHRPQYIVLNVNKDIRNTFVLEQQETLHNLPLNATIQKAHYMFDSNGYV